LKEITNLIQPLKKMLEEIEEKLKKQTQNCAGAIERFERQYKILRAEHQALINILKNLPKTHDLSDDVKNLIQELHDQMEEVKKHLQNLANCEELTKQNEERHQQLMGILEEIKEGVEKNAGSLKKITNSKLAKKLQELQKQIRELVQSIGQNEQTIKTLSGQIQALLQAFHDRRERTQALTGATTRKIQDLAGKSLEEVKKTIKDLEDLVESLQKILNTVTATQQLQSLKSTYQIASELVGYLNNAKSTKDDYLKRLETAQQHVQNLTNSLTKINEILSSFTQQVRQDLAQINSQLRILLNQQTDEGKLVWAMLKEQYSLKRSGPQAMLTNLQKVITTLTNKEYKEELKTYQTNTQDLIKQLNTFLNTLKAQSTQVPNYSSENAFSSSKKILAQQITGAKDTLDNAVKTQFEALSTLITSLKNLKNNVGNFLAALQGVKNTLGSLSHR